MHLKLPHSLKDEKEQWKKVDQFLYQNLPLLPDYTDEATSSDHPKNEKALMSTDTSTDTWTAKRSLSHWLAIVAIPVGIMGAIYLFWQENKTQVEVYVPAHDLPAYHQIQPSDLTPKPYASRAVPSDTLRTAQSIAGRYTLTPTPPRQTFDRQPTQRQSKPNLPHRHDRSQPARHPRHDLRRQTSKQATPCPSPLPLQPPKQSLHPDLSCFPTF